MVGVTVENACTVALLFLQLNTQLSKNFSYHPQNVRPSNICIQYIEHYIVYLNNMLSLHDMVNKFKNSNSYTSQLYLYLHVYKLRNKVH